MFVVALFVALLVLTTGGTPGYMLGVIALSAASFATQATIWIGLRVGNRFEPHRIE
jgi:hypothetical protein